MSDSPMSSILNAQFARDKEKLEDAARRAEIARKRIASVPPATPAVAAVNSNRISAMLAALGKKNTDETPVVVPAPDAFSQMMQGLQKWDGEDDSRVSRSAEWDIQSTAEVSATGTGLVPYRGAGLPVHAEGERGGDSILGDQASRAIEPVEVDWVEGEPYVEPKPEPEVVYRDRVIYVRDADSGTVERTEQPGVVRHAGSIAKLRVDWERDAGTRLLLTDDEIYDIFKQVGFVHRKALPKLTDAHMVIANELTLREQLEQSLAMEDAEYEFESELAAIGFDDEFDSAIAMGDGDVDPRFLSIMEGINFKPDESQQAAVRGLAKVQYGCLIGAAGTGKTSTVKILLNTLLNGDAEAGIEPLRIRKVNLKKYFERDEEALDEDYEEEVDEEGLIPAIAFVAYTGQATQVLKKNLPHGWKANAMTIHSLLGFVPESFNKDDGSDSIRFVPTYTYQNKMPWNVIFVDEASMVNVTLWHQLLEAAPEGCRFYMIGDLNQLPPPIGQGILGFALVKWPVFELTTVHRQADEAANKIVDAAWNVLQGKPIQFDDPVKDKNWRIISFNIDHNPDTAHKQIIAAAKQLAAKKVPVDVDPTEPAIYDPWRDRIMCAMNGYNEGDVASSVGQFPINESLSQVFSDPNDPRIIINVKRGVKKFKVGFRVMATKNEGQGTPDRVTNGLTGKIIGIEPNDDWVGDRSLVGYEDIVQKNRQAFVLQALGRTAAYDPDDTEDADDFNLSELKDIRVGGETQEEERDSLAGPASHIVTVQFDNGATRVYRRNGQIDQLAIAYASTVHKTQGAEMPTAIIVVHHAQRKMLSRELLYTAVTRASQRVVILQTEFGMRLALGTQRIYGNNLKEKAVTYLKLIGENPGDGPKFKVMDVALTYEDMEDRMNRVNRNLLTQQGYHVPDSTEEENVE